MSTDADPAELGRAEARQAAAFLSTVLPAALHPVYGERFIRSHVLYGEFVARLVGEVARAIGLDSALAASGTTLEVVERARLDRAQATVPVDWMLRYLAARRWIERSDGIPPRYRLARGLPTLDPAPVREAQGALDPSWMPAYALAETVARDYPAFLRGDLGGEEVLFAPRRLRLWVDYFSNDNGLYVVNNRLGAMAAAEWLPEGGGVILELGAGLGSGALALLAQLDSAGRLPSLAGYRFTELVSAFLRRGEQAVRARYGGLPGLAFGTLDMNRPFGEQGVDAGSISMVYAVNTLHAAHDLAFTLGEARRALQPGGWLVMSECVPPPEPIYADFVFNLAATFRSPLLGLGRSHGGFLSPEDWQVALEAAGFTDIRVLPDIARIRARVPDWSVAAIGAVRPRAG